jgi:hypothetical protein
MMAVARDQEADAIERAEARLTAWGEATGNFAAEYNVSRSLGLRAIIEHVQRAQAKRKIDGKKGEPKRRECLACGHVTRQRRWGARVNGQWNRRACPNCGHSLSRLREPTARGKETDSPPAPLNQKLSSLDMEIDAIVASLPGWAQVPLKRRYCWDQIDKSAAQDLRMSKRQYRSELDAGIEMVAETLSRGYSHSPRSRPIVAVAPERRHVR